MASWILATACSSSSSAAPPDGGTPGDEQPPPAPEDAGAPDVLGDTLDKPCDAVKQDCADPTLRCQIIFSAGEYVTGCETPWKHAGVALGKEGEVCSRTTTGHDDCANGLHCMLDGEIATSCHRLCAKDSDCGSGAKCGAITTVEPYFGVCWKGCTPFSAECPSETCSSAHINNDQTTTFEACREIGSGVLGSSCKAQYNCGADMNCQGSGGFKCKSICDDAHPCDGGTCTKSPGLPNNGGVCQ